MKEPAPRSPQRISEFAAVWFGAFVVAVMAATLVLLAFVMNREMTTDPGGPLELGQSWIALFWYLLFLLPIIGGLALPFAAGFSLLPELNGIRVRVWRYSVFGTAAGAVLVMLLGGWPGNEALEFPAAGAIGGAVLGALRKR